MMEDSSRRYTSGVLGLAVVGAACAALIVLGEALGSAERRVFWQLGGAALGVLFIVYGLILLLLRKLGTIGPRRAEAEDDLRGRWVKPVP
ncbi:MAG: hypothetical protein QN183_08850 [Armatimonadota bacterium]|nr:hypothetical protein [Armatimonadota bacterium]MDR7533339.1 hypothetical protein [Armatimonadota bacterium]MDR7536459.1 hypothetical protein [Armatimonadota bacterium]